MIYDNNVGTMLEGYKSYDIGRKGEKVVIRNLKANGYKIDLHDTKGAGATDIEASINNVKFLIQVKAAEWPNKPASMSSEEKRRMRIRSTKIGASPNHAKVQFNKGLTKYNISYDLI